MTLFHRPEMLILDEPLNALNPQGIYELRLILQKLNKEDGVTIFLSSHILDELEKVADLVAIIGDGKILYQGSIEELSKKQANLAHWIYVVYSKRSKWGAKEKVRPSNKGSVV